MNRNINFVGGTSIIASPLYNVCTIQQCIDWIKDIDIISLDTETTGLFDHQNRIIMLQLSDGIDVWVIDTRNTHHIQALKPYIEGKLILGQNLKFDYKFLKKEGVTLNNIYDTLLAECILTNGTLERSLGLAALAKKYCNVELDKSVRNQFIGLEGKPFTDKQIVYGAGDVLHLFEIRRKQLELIEYWELENVLELENKACLALADIEYNGLKLDIDSWLKLDKQVKAKLPSYEKELDDMVLSDSKLSKFVNLNVQTDIFGGTSRAVTVAWSSPTQVLKLFKGLGLPIQSSSEKDINIYQDQYPLVKKFIDYKKDQKLATTYGANFVNFINPVTRRVHGDFWQILDTFRVSCGGSKTSGKSSVNLQNLPAKNEYLNCFVAEEGKMIIGIDYAAQEARIAACGSQDELWLATFIEGKDLHSEVCKLMFGITDDLVKTKPDFLRGKTYRDAAKTLNFGLWKNNWPK